MKTMTKLFLMIALLGTTAMADGDQGNGGLTCSVNSPPPPCTINCGVAGGPVDETNITADTAFDDVIVVLVNDYLDLNF